MSSPHFRNMSSEAFKAYHQRTEDEATAHEDESKFRD
jgi:hypothetical protein